MKNHMKRSIQLLALTIGTLFSIHSVQAAPKSFPYYQQTLLNERVGFGRNATGGAGGEVTWVTNTLDSGTGSLRAACEDNTKRWIMFAVNGTIDLLAPISVHSDKTIDGRGASITLNHQGLRIVGARNIIVENLKFQNGVDTQDGLSIWQGAGDIWVDHCWFTNWQFHNALDVSDPHPTLLSDVTISWCLFDTQYLTMIIGGFAGDPSFNIRVTMHHNYFNGTDQRNPRIDGALVHAYNNYLYDWGEFGMIVSDYGQLLTEGNYLELVDGEKDAILATRDDPDGYHKELPANRNFRFGGAEIEENNPVDYWFPNGHVFPNGLPYTYQSEVNWIPLKANIISFSGAKRTSGVLANMSTRANVQSGQGNLISGFNISGSPSDSKRVIIRALGPSLSPYFPNAMGNPTLTIYNVYGQIIQSNDNWGDYQYNEIVATGLAPSNSLEAAWVGYLSPGTYSAAINGWGTGIAVLEIYDLQASAPAKLINISSRATVDPNNPPFAGFIAQSGWTKLLIRGIGPSLAQFGIQNPISDPTLTLYDANGTQIAYNNNWQDAPSGVSQLGFAPSDSREAVIVTNLAPGSYTVMLRDYYNNSGIGSIEMYKF
jgi:pectate lyase